MATVLITGANRGIGLEFCKQYAEAGWQVIACCREPSTAVALSQLAQAHQGLSVYALDVTDFLSIEYLANTLDTINLDVLINNAGVYGDAPGREFGALDYAAWSKTFVVNVQAPVKMAECFLPHLKRGQQKLLVTISSRMGSISDNTSGGSILYRSTKSALNAAMKSVALDLEVEQVGVLMLHPGWVKTDMGGADALISAEVSVTDMRQVIADFTMAQSGHFLRYNGATMPW